MEMGVYVNLNASSFERVREMAQEKGVTVAAFLGNLVSEYLEAHKSKTYQLPAHLRKWKGSLSGIQDADISDDARLDYLLKKHE